MRRSSVLRWALSAVLLTGCATPWRGSGEKGGTEPALFIHHVRIFDGQRVIPEGAVVVRGGKIVAVGADVAPPEGAEMLDGQGQTLLPGLIDAHFHEYAPDTYRQALAFGVTTVVDMFAHLPPSGPPVQLRSQRDANEADSVPGVLITVPGGHGSQFPGVFPQLATTPQECTAAVERAVTAGSRFIKLVYDSGETIAPQPVPTLSREVFARCVQAAHAHDRIAVVHATTLRESREALEAGADGLVHGLTDVLPDEALVRTMAARRVLVVPTLAVTDSAARRGHPEALLEDARVAPYLTPSGLMMETLSFPDGIGARLRPEVTRQYTRQLEEAGVPVLAGSDCGNPGVTAGAGLHVELGLLVDAGLTPVQALAAATSRPAAGFHLADRGRIAPGLRADLLLVEGDPTADIHKTLDIRAVWKEGRRLDRDAYRMQLQAQR